MDAQQTLNRLAKLAGSNPLQVGDLADIHVIGRVQVIDLEGSTAEVRTAKGDRLKVRRQLLRKVHA